METYLSFTVQVYKDRLPNGTLTDYSEVVVVAKTEEEALKRATEILKRENYQYRVKQVNEYEKVGKNN